MVPWTLSLMHKVNHHNTNYISKPRPSLKVELNITFSLLKCVDNIPTLATFQTPMKLCLINADGGYPQSAFQFCYCESDYGVRNTCI